MKLLMFINKTQIADFMKYYFNFTLEID